MTNTKIYIHEFVDILGHNRANYMQHITANWSPVGQEERNQLCYGVWAVFGSTGRWPEVINMWEHDGWDGLAASFAVEAVGPAVQDPKLGRWWARATEFRRGGLDRILEPAPWTPTITELCVDAVNGECYSHELVRVRGGAAAEFLEQVRERAAPIASRYGWKLAGAFKTALVNDDECLLLWAVPSWQRWADLEKAQHTDADLRAWRHDVLDVVQDWQRIMLVDAPLSPLRTGRQPSREDRVDWED